MNRGEEIVAAAHVRHLVREDGSELNRSAGAQRCTDAEAGTKSQEGDNE